MKQDASWWLESQNGMGLGGSGLSAILRDLGRFGLVVVNEAVIDGKGVVPKNWFDDRRQARGVRIFVVATFRG